MAGQREFEKSSARELEDYLRSLKSPDGEAGGESPGGEESLEDYLLERAAKDLRDARARLENLRRSLDRE